ncbi:transposase [Subtercola boreus]|nr:transposase [Subtercola boreus]TQL54241.1 hypothetical protein FB464_1774 [Subtercola boreus]
MAEFSCPNCGHTITRDEERAEAALDLGVWICPACGFEAAFE